MFTVVQNYDIDYEGRLCNCAESTPSDLKIDIVDHSVGFHNNDLTDVLKKFTCKNCKFQTYSFLVFNKHNCKPWELKIEEKASDSNTDFNCAKGLEFYKCTDCDFYTNLKLLLKSHTNHVHKSHLCDSLTALDLQKSFTCTKCTLQTCSILVKYKHVCTLVKTRRNERQIVWLECEFCNFKTRWKRSLQRHLLSKHPPEKRHKCKHCDYTSTQMDLNVHSFRAHSPEHLTPFRCIHCGWKSKREDCLATHLRLKHELWTWFQCEQCEFKTKKKKNLRMHRARRHTADTEINWIKCDFCPYLGKERAYLSKHVWNKHQVKM